MGTLYIVATPIGNLKDITLRAIEILSNVPVIACEDTRRTRLLLNSLSQREQKPQRLISYYEQNELVRMPEILNLLINNVDIALVSDAGTPTISDPGFKIVRECIKQNIRVESIPGPCSAIAALSISGLPTDKFLFVGYLPKKPGHRKTQLKEIKKVSEVIKQTIIIFEAPHRVHQLLNELEEAYGDINIVTARELTKVYESVQREKISVLRTQFKKGEPKGEFVILFNLGNKYTATQNI